jgi:predicted amidophosphoribosyltransferase
MTSAFEEDNVERVPVASDRAPVTDAEVEAAIARAREKLPVCPDCGPRPEPDALYCSHCGNRLPAS